MVVVSRYMLDVSDNESAHQAVEGGKLGATVIEIGMAL